MVWLKQHENVHTISHSNRKDCHDLARDLLRQQTLASNLSVQQQQKLEDANQTLVHAQTLLDQETRLAAQTLMSIKHYSLHQNHQVSIQEPEETEWAVDTLMALLNHQ